MKAMILAAGLGKRMRPLTDHTPKPLLLCAGKPLIVYHIEALVAAGVTELVINHAYLGEQICVALGDGERYGAQIQYSAEQQPMDTGAGIVNALPLLGEQPFILTNADVWSDFDYRQLVDKAVERAHLVLVDNPDHNPAGDFCLQTSGRVVAGFDQPDGIALTFAGISVLSPALFDASPVGRFPLKQPLLAAMQQQQVSGQHHRGGWVDVGTPQRLQQLERRLLATH